MAKILDKKKTYIVELTQGDVDVIFNLVGGVTGSGEVREVANELFKTFDTLEDNYSGLFHSINAKTQGDFTFG